MDENILFLGFFGILICCLAWLPGYIARKNGHKRWKEVRVLGWFGLLFAFCWIAALIWAFIGERDEEMKRREERDKWEVATANIRKAARLRAAREIDKEVRKMEHQYRNYLWRQRGKIIWRNLKVRLKHLYVEHVLGADKIILEEEEDM
jgi:type VI protein secretion system component VasK